MVKQVLSMLILFACLSACDGGGVDKTVEKTVDKTVIENKTTITPLWIEGEAVNAKQFEFDGALLKSLYAQIRADNNKLFLPCTIPLQKVVKSTMYSWGSMAANNYKYDQSFNGGLHITVIEDRPDYYMVESRLIDPSDPSTDGYALYTIYYVD